ncbi:hypothetical protein SPHV1_2280006 [Novosphingobium sp. KN65.2]|nr:hypothetical protein SPHV1_2280006 [Novosphingobium sp. KN65.2]
MPERYQGAMLPVIPLFGDPPAILHHPFDQAINVIGEEHMHSLIMRDRSIIQKLYQNERDMAAIGEFEKDFFHRPVIHDGLEAHRRNNSEHMLIEGGATVEVAHNLLGLEGAGRQAFRCCGVLACQMALPIG